MGVSFSPRHAAFLGLEPVAALRRVLELGFRMVRLSAFWDQVRSDGYGELDRMIDTAGTAGVPVLLTVGMKAMRWPEFYAPAGLTSQQAGEQVVAFVADTVRRYPSRSGVAAWQVENEPLNRSGPARAMVPERVLRREIRAVRELDARPIVLNGFWHFERLLDWSSRPRPWRRVDLRLLRLLGDGDVLGIDFYSDIGRPSSRLRRASHARPSWPAEAGRLRSLAESRGAKAWVIESQAEPWLNEQEFGPERMAANFRGLRDAGFETILLWGCEHWLKRDAGGDPSWLSQAGALARG